jgi:leucyl aminopeptidase
MEFKIFDRSITETVCDCVIIGKFEDAPFEGMALELDKALSGALSQITEEELFKGKVDTTLLVHTLGKMNAKKAIVVGLGKKDKFNVERVRRAAGLAAKKAEEVKSAHIALAPITDNAISPSQMSQAMVEGVILATYAFDKYFEKKKKEDKRPIETVQILTPKSDETTKAIQTGAIVGESVNFARDIVNEPGNIITPEKLADIAMQLASEDSSITCRIYKEDEIEKMGMGSYLAVGWGSSKPPRFIHLTYTPSCEAKAKVAIIGKGLTFDAGGLNLKTFESMKDMKTDKSGACAVLGMFKALPKLKPCKEVHGIIAAVENMPDGNAMRPDDILTAMNGKTIEIGNTDAEGRLTLADALCYAGQLKPDRIIDLATLTGACIVALGDYTVGVMGNNQPFIDEILKISDAAGEHMWQLPLYEQMRDKIKSEVADMNNIGGKWGGAITAAMFLENFVDSTPWVHLDIAGPASNSKGWAYNPKGASGVGVRTLLKYLTTV